MKYRVISLLLAFVFLIGMPITAFASGDGNVDSGGGGMGSGTSTDSWNPGHDGVRVSVINAETGAVMGTPIDYTNISPSPAYHFGSKSKINYRGGASLTVTTSTYQYRNPSPALPRIISSGSGNASLEAIKRYFCSEGAARMIANDFGVSFELLTNGNYKLFLEPIAYFRFQGQYVAMTAHETALYDQQLSGGVRRTMASLSHQNLPLAMFLERPDLGFSAYSGDTTGRQSNDTIIAHLGMGIVSYTDMDETPPPEPSEYDIEYRINTEVITSVMLNASSEINPDAPATVTFTVSGRSYTMSNIVIPEGESQVVWFKWTTPATEQIVTITVSTNRGWLSDNRINAKVVDLGKNPPPDPKADDRNNSFSAVSAPSKTQITSARWTVWWAQWHPFWEWEADWRWVADVRWVSDWRWVSSYYWVSNGMGGGYYVDNGYWRDYGYYYDFGRWVDFGKWVDNGWYDCATRSRWA